MGFFERQGALSGLEVAAGLIGGGEVDAAEDDPSVAREGFEPEFFGAFVLAVEVGAVGGAKPLVRPQGCQLEAL